MINLPRDNSVKIVKQALSFQTPDRLPVFDSFWQEFADNWRNLRHPPPDVSVEDYYWTDIAIIAAREQLFPSRIREVKKEGNDTYHEDGWGRIVRKRQNTHFSETVDRMLKAPRHLDKIEFEPADLDIRYEEFERQVAQQRAKGRTPIVKIGGPYLRTAFFRGQVELLTDLAEDPSFAAALVERVGQHLLEIGLESLKRTDTYDTGLWIFDDMCNVNAPMFSPKTFEAVFLPTYKHMVSTLKRAGAKWVMLHCDGNLEPLLDLALAAGIDGINPVEYNAGLDVVELAEKYRGRLRFIGGVCNCQILPSGDPEKITRHIRRIIDAGRNGGLIIGAHSIGPDISVESYELYRKLVAEFGKYK